MKEKDLNNDNFIYGNYYNKYESKNFLAKFLIDNFIKNINKILDQIEYGNLLDIGCGEGYLTNELASKKKTRAIGIDPGKEPLEEAKRRYKDIEFIKCSAYKLPFDDVCFDLVTVIEVLEHLDSPGRALEEIKRVAKNCVILSVPNEPLWRILNVMSLRYLKRWGNTPGHINHWTPKGFINLVEKDFKILKILKPIPWTIILAERINK